MTPDSPKIRCQKLERKKKVTLDCAEIHFSGEATLG